ncbi:MAG: hypothetical protein WBM17_12815 [Anaerolineales bacterium]
MPKLKSTIWLDLLIILAAGAFAILLRFQGWKGRELLHVDMLPYYAGANEFLSTGRVVEKGQLSSYSSYSPPGAFFFLIPGVWTASDPRLQDLAGTVWIVYATLFFLYLAAREAFGRMVAISTAVVFALSLLGSSGLWPIGHPLFIVASLYFLLRWVKRRAAWALGAALAVMAFGMYFHLSIVPFLLVIPVLWLIFRPPIGWKSLLLSAAFGLLVWFPYLKYEYGRGFVDLASMLLQRPADTVWEGNSEAPIYCYATQPGENDVPEGTYLPYVGGTDIEARVVYPLPGWKQQLAYGSCRMMMNVDRNFDQDLFVLGAERFSGSILWLVFMIGWMTLGWVVARAWKPLEKIVQAVAVKRKWIPLALAAAGMLVIYLTANPAVLEKFAADNAVNHNIILAAVQFREYMPWIWFSICLGLFLSVYVPDGNPDSTILCIAFSLPWIILVIFAEPGRPERFWFMWPLQVLVMVLFLHWLAEHVLRARPLFWILAAALGVALLPVPYMAERISQIRDEGYSGADSNQWKVVEFLAGKAGTGEDRVLRVEYKLVDSPLPGEPQHPDFLFAYWFDYILLARYGVRNAGPGECPEESSCEIWEVVDSNAGIPDALQGITPEAVFGNYLIFRLP